MYKTTKTHPQLKEGLKVKRATNPKGMHLADAYFVMTKIVRTKSMGIYYESDFLDDHIEKGYIKNG